MNADDARFSACNAHQDMVSSKVFDKIAAATKVGRFHLDVRREALGEDALKCLRLLGYSVQLREDFTTGKDVYRIAW